MSSQKPPFAYIDTPFGLLCIHINQIRRLVGVKFLELLRKQWSLSIA
jgi:hypothetical protein